MGSWKPRRQGIYRGGFAVRKAHVSYHQVGWADRVQLELQARAPCRRDGSTSVMVATWELVATGTMVMPVAISISLQEKPPRMGLQFHLVSGWGEPHPCQKCAGTPGSQKKLKKPVQGQKGLGLLNFKKQKQLNPIAFPAIQA